MCNRQGHVFVVDWGDAAIQDEPIRKFPLGVAHLSLLRELWRFDVFEPNKKFIQDNRKNKIQARPYGEFIMALFENAGKKEDKHESKDLNDMLSLLNNLLEKNKHPRRITFEKDEKS